MKKFKAELTTSLFLFMATFLLGQQVSLSVKVNKDTIAIDEVVVVEFRLDNLTGNFKAPGFMGFQVVSGPNTSSSFRMINGEVSQNKSYSYVLVPVDKGSIMIGAASVENNGDVISTDEFEIFVSERYRSSTSGAKDRIFMYDKDTSTPTSTPKKKRPLKKI